MKSSIWKNFKNDPYYLVKYFSISLLVLSAILLIQFQFVNFDLYTNFTLSYEGLILLPLGLVIGIKVPVLIHNCVHGNLKTPILNRIVGEIAGLYVFLGMAAFFLNHRMHHVHNDTDLDPHNPDKKGFIKFFFANNFGGTEPVLLKFLNFHGDTKKNRGLFYTAATLHFLAVPFRAAVWLFLLGPSLFICFFIPSYLFHMFVFAHINYVTHETFEDGTVEIYNKDSNIYYRFVNYFGSGVYFHKNHHINPNFYNPQLST